MLDAPSLSRVGEARRAKAVRDAGIVLALKRDRALKKVALGPGGVGVRF